MKDVTSNIKYYLMEAIGLGGFVLLAGLLTKWLPAATFIEVAEAGHLLPVGKPREIAAILITEMKL